MHPFLASIVFLWVSGILFFVPGWVILRVFFRNTRLFMPLETLIFSFGISLGLIDFLMIIIGKYGFKLNAFTITLGLAASLMTLVGVVFIWKRFNKNPETETEIKTEIGNAESFFFTKKQGWIFVILITLTILTKGVFLAHAVLPTATDLGHHMYWAKLISTTGALPFYAKQEIVTTAEGVYQLTNPQPIIDFIIGEHLPFAAINIVSGLDFLSAFPVVFLFLYNLLGLIALFVLALRFTEDIRSKFFSKKIFTPQNVALVVLFFFGPLYTLASPQAKFVSGGVVGNTLGNFFIPLIILAYFRAFKEKNPRLLALGFFLTLTLAYTHHLSMLMLAFTLAAGLLTFLFLNANALRETLLPWLKLFFSPAPILTIFLAGVFFFAVALPTYIGTNAVSTALGTPTKTTRTGLTFLQITFSSGEARVALGLAGLVIILAAFAFRRKGIASAFLVGWSAILLLMTYKPAWLLIDIPSNRIGAYLSFPLGMLSAIAAVAFFAALYKQETNRKIYLPHLLFLTIGFSLFVFSIGSGTFDNSQTLLARSKASDALQTFDASNYLAEHSLPEDTILKDHNYIVADSWIKLFFLRDYSYPLSRGFFKRYTDNPKREQCTLLMISTPNTPRGEKCYNDLGVDFVMINPHFDTAQFKKSQNFSRIYASDNIHIYSRIK